jgi:CRISPR-associated protein Cmr1
LARSVGNCPKQPECVNSHPDYETRIYEIQVITPIFGGGSEIGVSDLVTPIRPSSIRGHLRFWWRATGGAKFEDTKRLRDREGEIWGTTNWPSPVIIEVIQPDKDKIQPVNPQNYRNLAYVLFPTREKRNQLLKEGFSFGLRVSWLRQSLLQVLRNKENEALRKLKKPEKSQIFKEIGRDVEAAIWAWINFGGIGARTRRGCGALYCIRSKPEDLEINPPSFEGFGNWMKNCISRYGLEHPIHINDWPTIGEIHLKSGSSSISCWEASIRALKDMRQGANVGRDNGHGRSRWPEAESVIKLVLETNDLKHRPGWHDKDPRISDIAFPRAEFGLPIIIEIRGESLTPRGVNIKPTLQVDEEIDRMASPLILRPIKFRNDEFASMIIRLNKTPLDSAYLKPGKSDLARPRSIKSRQIADARLANYKDSPMNRGLRTGSAVDAFLAYANEEGFLPVFP